MLPWAFSSAVSRPPSLPIAALNGLAAGGFVLLASVVFGLAAGLCIGGLIAANFAMLAVEEKEKEEADAHSRSAARVAA
jgi:hypothetical protein